MTAGRQTRGFLFADLRGYSKFTEQHGDDAARDLLRRYRTLVREIIARHAGAEIRTEGDSFYVVFESLGEAVTAGLEILEEAAAAATTDADRSIGVGIGIHAGETIDDADGIISSAVNIAARVCATARPGQLLVTETVRSLTRGYLPVAFAPLGRRRLKGIRDPVTLFEVTRRAWAPAAVRRIPHAVQVGGAFAAAVVVVAVVAAAMAINGWMTTARDGVSSPPTTTAQSASDGAFASPSPLVDPDAPFPTAAEERLLGLLDERDRERCQRADPDDGPILTIPRIISPGGGSETLRFPVPYVGGIDCALGGITAPDRLLFWDVRQPSGVGSFTTTGDASAMVFQQAGRVDAPRGSCADGAPALEAWSFGDASGDLVCYETTTGDAIIIWSVDDSTLLGRAVRDDRDMGALLEWWLDEGRFAE